MGQQGVPETVASGTRVLLAVSAENEPFAEQLAASFLEQGQRLAKRDE